LEIKITEAIEGKNSITTETGYTFDKDGLNIHKEGEAMHNTLDNTGMYVRRDNTDVLVANDEGVNAINLTARQYLIVGNNARFEDYPSNRTACFYIGG
jgi:pyridoxine 5'-phosphate synthase PdxJ